MCICALLGFGESSSASENRTHGFVMQCVASLRGIIASRMFRFFSEILFYFCSLFIAHLKKRNI